MTQPVEIVIRIHQWVQYALLELGHERGLDVHQLQRVSVVAEDVAVRCGQCPDGTAESGLGMGTLLLLEEFSGPILFL